MTCSPYMSLQSRKNDKQILAATDESRKDYLERGKESKRYGRTLLGVRFEVSRHGILYPKIETSENIEFVLGFYSNRFPLFLIVLQTTEGCYMKEYEQGIIYVKGKQLKELIPQLEKEMPVNPILEDLEDYSDEIWHTYYDNQFIEERYNKKHFMRFIPKYQLKKESFRHERFVLTRCKSLKEFE